MRVIIAGSRTIDNYASVEQAIVRCPWLAEVTEVVCGGARGVDAFGARWAKANGIRVKVFHAEWRPGNAQYNKRAGIDRNERMAEYADALIAVWDGHSRGTTDMIARMQRRNKRTYVVSPFTMDGAVCQIDTTLTREK